MADSYLFGVHAVTVALNCNPERIIRLQVLDERQHKAMQSIITQAQELGIKIERINKKQIEKQAGAAVHQGVIALCKPVSVKNEDFLEQLLDNTNQPLLLVLDGITDPHNLGACLRTADSAGVHAVIAPKDQAAPLNATAAKVACGAAETVPYIQVTNLARVLKKIKNRGIWVIGTAGEADTNLWQTDMSGAIALVMGAEGHGIRQLTRSLCDQLIKIPMEGMISSLNVSVATGICLFEIKRQQQ